MARTATGFRPRRRDAVHAALLGVTLGNLGHNTTGWIDMFGRSRAELYLDPTKAATLLVEHCDDGATAIAADSETWVVAATWAGWSPFAAKRRYLRFTLTDTGGGGAVVCDLYQDPRPVDPDLALPGSPLFAVLAGGGGGKHDFPIPPGARTYLLEHMNGVNIGFQGAVSYRPMDATHTHGGPIVQSGLASSYGPSNYEPLPPFCEDGATRPEIIYAEDTGVDGARAWWWFYP